MAPENNNNKNRLRLFARILPSEIVSVPLISFLVVGFVTYSYQQDVVKEWDNNVIWPQMYVAAFIMVFVLSWYYMSVGTRSWIGRVTNEQRQLQGNERIFSVLFSFRVSVCVLFVGFVTALVFFGNYLHKSHAFKQCENGTATLAMEKYSNCASKTQNMLCYFCIGGFVVSGFVIVLCFCKCQEAQTKPSNSIEEDSNNTNQNIDAVSNTNELQETNKTLETEIVSLKQEIERLKRNTEHGINQRLLAAVPLPPIEYKGSSASNESFPDTLQSQVRYLAPANQNTPKSAPPSYQELQTISEK